MPTTLVPVGLLLAAAPPTTTAESVCPAAAFADDDEKHDWGESSRAKPKDPKDVCLVANSNVAREEDAVLRAPPAQKPLAPVP